MKWRSLVTVYLYARGEQKRSTNALLFSANCQSENGKNISWMSARQSPTRDFKCVENSRVSSFHSLAYHKNIKRSYRITSCQFKCQSQRKCVSVYLRIPTVTHCYPMPDSIQQGILNTLVNSLCCCVGGNTYICLSIYL